jgi:hypothetical protein
MTEDAAEGERLDDADPGLEPVGEEVDGELVEDVTPGDVRRTRTDGST